MENPAGLGRRGLRSQRSEQSPGDAFEHPAVVVGAASACLSSTTIVDAFEQRCAGRTQVTGSPVLAEHDVTAGLLTGGTPAHRSSRTFAPFVSRKNNVPITSDITAIPIGYHKPL